MLSHQRLLYSTTIFTAVLLASLPAIAQTSTVPFAKPATISGRVVNENGQPLPNATVSLRRAGSIDIENLMTSTDREGKFELTGLQPVSYHVFAWLRGYAPRLRDLADPQGGIYRGGDSVTLVLTKGGVITGAVTNQTGEPVVGVMVRTQNVGTRLPFPYDQIGLADMTDDRGIYRIYGLPEGTYVVWAGGGGESRYTMNVDPFDSDVSTYAPSSTRDTAQEIVVRSGSETNVDIQYRGGPGHSISGSASGPKGAQPLQFGINVVSVNGPQWETRTVQGFNDRGFTIEGIDDGDYTVIAMSYQTDGAFMFSDAKQISVRGADVSGVELVVEPLISVVGRVLLEESKTAECGDKQRPVLTETLITAQSSGLRTFQRAARFLSPTANADDKGNVLLKNLPAGRYYFTTQYFAKDWYLKSLSFVTENTKTTKPTDAARGWTTLRPGEQLNGLTITLAQGASSVSGQVVFSNGETPAENLYVYLVPAEKESADDVLRVYGAAVTADGKVAFNNLAPGRYLLLARANTESPLTRLYSPEEKTYRLKLRREAEAAKNEIELKPCQALADLKVRVRTSQ